jgi:hypothetical protein
MRMYENERSVSEDIALIVMVCLLIGMLCSFVRAG